MYREKIDAYIDSKKDEMLADLIALVKINSERGEAKEGKPFGEGPYAVLQEAKAQLSRYGLNVTDYDGYVVTGDYGEGEKALDILAHLDVVPVTDGWKVTDPFTPKIVGDRIYGRGTADDKGPAIAALYAVRAIKELGIPLKYSLRLILGSDEECGSSDLGYYYAKEQEARYSFTPDADFPLINLEKARLAKHVRQSFASQPETLVCLEAGDKVNVVPAKAKAVLKGIDVKAVQAAGQDIAAKTGVQVNVLTGDDDTCTIEVQGTAAHGSTPEEGNNALTALLAVLAPLPLGDGEMAKAVRCLAELFPHGDTTGKTLGIEMADEKSGALSFNLGVLSMDAQGMDLQYDIRCPLCGNDENVTKVLAKRFSEAGMQMEEGAMIPAHYVPEESAFVQTLLGSYERYFGKKGKPLYTGGGTYVHELERGVAFGCMVSDVDNHMHGDDEFMEIDMLLRSAKIFADAIIKLCNMDEA